MTDDRRRGYRLPVGEPVDLEVSPRCPSCDAILDGATVVGERGEVRPEPGNLTICAYCGAVLVFAEGLELEAVPADEVAALEATHYELRAARAAVRFIRSHRDDGPSS